MEKVNTTKAEQESENFLESISTKLQDLYRKVSEWKLFTKNAEKQIPLENKTTYHESLNRVLIAGKRFSKFFLTKFLPGYLLFVVGVNALQKKDRSFSEKEKAKIEMINYGITAEQSSAHKVGLSEMIYEGIDPWSYELQEHAKDFVPNLFSEREYKYMAAREDAWRLYLGLSQTHNTFGISDYQPQDGKDDKFYFKINNFKNAFISSLMNPGGEDGYATGSDLGAKVSWYLEIAEVIKKEIGTDSLSKILEVAKRDMGRDNYQGFELFFTKGIDPFARKAVLEYVEYLKRKGGTEIRESTMIQDNLLPEDFLFLQQNMDHKDKFKSSDVMRHYVVTLGEDENGTYISYYDNWDLALVIENNDISRIGRPYEIYDRLYYNHETGEILNTK